MNKKHTPNEKPTPGTGKQRQKGVAKPTEKAGAQAVRQKEEESRKERTIADIDRHNGSGGAFEATEMGHNDE